MISDHIIFVEDPEQIQAMKELSYYIRDIGKNRILSIFQIVWIIKKYKSEYMSNLLVSYIRSRSFFDMFGDIHSIIIRQSGNYLDKKLHPGWKIAKRRILARYVFRKETFVNIYNIPINKLPLYINYAFDKVDKENYLERLRGISHGAIGR